MEVGFRKGQTWPFCSVNGPETMTRIDGTKEETMGAGKALTGKKYGSWDEVFQASRQMAFRALNTGEISSSVVPYTQAQSIPAGFDASQTVSHAVMVFHFHHPEKGDILIDSGFDRSFYETPPFGNLSSFVIDFLEGNRARYTQQKDEDLGFQLQALNIHPSHLFLTHMHPDHTAGIPALSPRCNICYGKKENSAHYRLMTGSHLKGRENISLIDVDSAPGILPFDHAVDLFGDGSFWALSTPGHTKDHLAYLINADPTPILIAGDAELSAWGMEHGVFMNTDYGEEGKQAVQASAGAIRAFHGMYPHVAVWFSHDDNPLK
ncbi:MBL fold metallo-hydrolase [Desulfoluna spongiiphila]|uniref:MBL fold metallo-hydrolase n=1 Tax=Desulfoluna spongiiphila TaxID=419481 RepID=UPI00125F170A|nr:MBL fold metallo-hydrolase [Desulfoluna spongiiphila]